MRICVAQTSPVKGDIRANMAKHKSLISLAISERAELVVFPELSLTGYEPTLAKELATLEDDGRFDDFQIISDTEQVTIGVGMPTKNNDGILISMLLFRPRQERCIYSKTYLHRDEEPFFVPGRSSPDFQINHTRMALAICYEISVPSHLEAALKSNPEIYLASVVKSVNGINQACERLSQIARDCSMPVLMANSVGVADGTQSAGRTSVWNNRGLLLGQLNDSDEGILVFDTKTAEITQRRM